MKFALDNNPNLLAALKNAKKVIVAPLNWGLGHATRSMVIIDHLIKLNKEVLIACDGLAATLLKQSYPDLVHHILPSYDINYSGRSFLFTMMKQVPKIMKAIGQEHTAVRELQENFNADLIISDNRYGCYHEDAHSIMLTHQLHPYFKNAILSRSSKTIIKGLVKNFDTLWVPDHVDRLLSGSLSDSKGYENVEYIGPLTRLEIAKDQKDSIDFLAIISGPEPARTLFEEKIIDLFLNMEKSCFIIRGTQQKASKDLGSLAYIDLADRHFLAEQISKAKNIVTRSGYSTIMDLAQANKKVYIVPTPGQTEQEYLSDYLNGKMGFVKLLEDDLEQIK